MDAELHKKMVDAAKLVLQQERGPELRVEAAGDNFFTMRVVFPSEPLVLSPQMIDLREKVYAVMNDVLVRDAQGLP